MLFIIGDRFHTSHPVLIVAEITGARLAQAARQPGRGAEVQPGGRPTGIGQTGAPGTAEPRSLRGPRGSGQRYPGVTALALEAPV